MTAKNPTKQTLIAQILDHEGANEIVDVYGDEAQMMKLGKAEVTELWERLYGPLNIEPVKRETKKSLIEQIHAYPEHATLDVNGMSMKELRDILKIAEAGLADPADLAELSNEEIDSILSDEPVTDTSLSETAEKLTKAVENLYDEAKATEPETEAETEEKETISIHDVMDAAAETYLAERNAAAEALHGNVTAAALKRATELQALGSRLALTPAGKYIKTYNVEGAYVTNDGNWIAVKDEKGAAEKKPWTLYEVSGGTLRDLGHFKSSATAFDPEVSVFANWLANLAAA